MAHHVKPEKPIEDNFVDTTKPSSGRIYDYYLGGNHNFEVDRQVGDYVLSILPFMRKFARLQRWALQDIAVELTVRREFDVLIDFASGLPTADHLHNFVSEGTIVIYSDYDPVVVQQAKRILEGKENIYYFENDATRPEDLLERPEVVAILNGRRKVGIVYWGIAGFLFDEEVKHAMDVLYNWADAGSTLAFNAQAAGFDVNHPDIVKMLELYNSFGQSSHMRTFEEFTELVRPWVPETKFSSLLEWHGFGLSELAREDVAAFGPMGGGYGAYMTK